MIEELTAYLIEHGENIALWASVIGVPIGIGAIAISIKIFRKTQHIEEEQRKNAEGLYVSKTKEYLKTINDYVDDVFGIIENHNKEDDEESSLITTELNLYFRKHHGEMIQLMEKSERSLELWTSLDRPKRDEYDKILVYFNWLTSKFFPLTTKGDNMRTKIWKAEYKQFLQMKYFIDRIIKNEVETKVS